MTNLSTLDQLQAQNAAVLRALETLKADNVSAFSQYNEAITNQLNTLKDALLIQRERQARAAQDSNRFIVTIAAAVAGAAMLAMVLSALLPVWVMKRFAAARSVAQIEAGRDILGAPLKALAGSTAALGNAMGKLEQRLLALEKRTNRLLPIPDIGNEAMREQGPGKLTKQPGAPAAQPESHSSPVPATKPEAPPAKLARWPQFALTLGEGEALGFLPRETAFKRFRSLRAFASKCRRMFRAKSTAHP